MGHPNDRRRRRRPIIYNRTSHRLREIERIIGARHGKLLDTDDADLYLVPVAQAHRHLDEAKHGQATADRILDRITVWAQVRTPLVTREQLLDAAREAMHRPKMGSADALATRLRLTYAERQSLRITTIGACDLNKAGRTRKQKERKRARERARAAAKRAARGAIPRAEYLAKSRSRVQPWKAQGVSRRTYYRRIARGGGTSQLPSNLLSGGQPTCAKDQAQPSRLAGDPLVVGST